MLDPERLNRFQRPPALRRQARNIDLDATGGQMDQKATAFFAALPGLVNAGVVTSHSSSSVSPRYRDVLRTLAQRLVGSAIRAGDASPECNDDLVRTAQSEINVFIGRRMVRFPRLASNLLIRFADTLLPRSTWNALRHAALIAILKRARHLKLFPQAGSSGQVSHGPTAAEIDSVAARVEAMIERARLRAKRDRVNVRPIRTHVAPDALPAALRARLLPGYGE